MLGERKDNYFRNNWMGMIIQFYYYFKLEILESQDTSWGHKGNNVKI